MRTNPFFQKYNTPFEVPPFDQIRMEDYEEAFMEGIRREDEHLEIMLNNPEPPTFDNTILNEEEDEEKNEYYSLLDKVSSVFFNLMSADANDEMEALAQKIQPALTKHSNDIALNGRLFERIKAVYENHRELTAEENALLEKVYKGFVRRGALLDDEGKARLRELSEEFSMLALKFAQNELKETKDFILHITDENDLQGIPENHRRAAEEEAKERGLEGWVFTLDMPSYGPFLKYADNRELREKLFMAYNTICTHDNENNNIEICRRMVNIRRELAQLLGYESHADYVLENRMASNTANVYKLLNDLIDAYKPAAEAEREELKDMARRCNGEDFELKPWDASYYSNKLLLEKYNVDAEMARPYFELDKVIKGVFDLAGRLYGLFFMENDDIPVYHPDVKAYTVYDKDETYLAVLYADFYPRNGKQGGAWMTSYQEQYITKKGENVRPHVSLVMNFSKPTEDKPALLTLDEVETFLHEFGHSLHAMFSNVRFVSLSGTNVWWDFVELPSQFMENFSLEREFLSTFAFHYETGEPIPDELVQRLIDSRNFAVGSGCLRQVSFGLLDMAYHTMTKPFDEDLIRFEKKAWEKAIIGKQLENTCMTVHFSHIMSGGYSAGYYSYKWAEVLDADAFAVFKREGIFNKETAQRFRDCILSKGGTEHPMTLYKRFRGGEPTIDALLERNGIKRPQQ